MCGRDKFLLDRTKSETGKLLTQSCTRRCVVYQTHCETCYRRECDKIDEQDLDEKNQTKTKIRNKVIPLHRRKCQILIQTAWEHHHALDQLSPDSHMLKHIVEMHADC